MNYKSTRDVKVNVPSAYAISQGLSADGGLFVGGYWLKRK